MHAYSGRGQRVRRRKIGSCLASASAAAAFRRFHEEVAALAAQIEELTPGADFEVRLRKLVDAEVVPAINASRDDLVRGYEGAVGKVAGAAASASGAALVATVLPGVGLLEVLVATGAAAVAALKGGTFGEESIGALVDVWKGRRQERRNAYAYLTRL